MNQSTRLALRALSKLPSLQPLLRTTAPWVVVIAAALLPLLLVFYFAFDAPIWDDIDIHLDFLIRLGQAQTFSEQLGLWFHPNGEHFVLPNKAAAWLCQAFFGSVNYRALLIAGSLAVPISLALLLVPLRGSQRGALWGAAMMALIFCSPRYDQSLLWASGAWQHMWELPFALGFLVFVFSNQRRLQIVSLVCAVAATLTQGNGALVLFAAAVPFAFKRSGRRAVACGLIGLLLLIPLVNNSLHSAASAPLPSLPELGVYVCTFLGSGIGFSATSAAILGTLLLALHLFLQLRTSSRDAPAYFAILAWCVLTAAANAIGRAGFGASYAWEQTRYQLPSLLYIAILAWLTVSLLVPIGQRKIALVVTTLGGAALFIFSLIGAVPAFQSRHDLAESAAIRWSYFKGYPEHPSKEHATKILLAADRLGVYRPITESVQIGEEVEGQHEDVPHSPKVRSEVEYALRTDEWFLLSGYAFMKGSPSGPERIVVKILGPQSSRLFSAALRTRLDVSQHFKQGRLKRAGFLLFIPSRLLGDGDRFEIQVFDTLGSAASKSRSLPISTPP